MSGNNDMPDGLGDDDAKDCIDHIEGVIGIRLTRVQMLGVLDARLIAEISEWGIDDTEVRGRIENALSLHLIDQPWPLRGDDTNLDSHLSELRAAARKSGYELVELTDDDAAAEQAGQATDDDGPLPVRHLIVTGGDDRTSMLERLTPQEHSALFSWSRAQVPSTPGGSIDLMAWPGWADVLRRLTDSSSAAWTTALDVIDRIKLNSAK